MSVGFSKYWRRVQTALPILLVVSSMAAFVAYLVIRGGGVTYEVHFSYLISLATREDVSEYRFDGYYALQATDLFATTVAQWAKTPEVIVAAHEQAQLPLASQDPRKLLRIVSTAKTAPQLVEVTVYGQDREATLKLAQGLITVIERSVERYHEHGIPALSFRVVATDPWVGVREVSVPLIVGATFLVVLLISVNAVLLIESFKHLDREG
jgi:hypothetical protein